MLEKGWPGYDFSAIDPIYPRKTGLYEPSEDAYKERARFAKRWLLVQPEECIIVVTRK